MRVTPVQSEAVQKICFANNIYWGRKKEILYTQCPFLYISRVMQCDAIDSEDNFKEHPFGEVDADLFIRTNGTCEEPTEQKEYPRWFKYKGVGKIIIKFLDLTSGIVVGVGDTNEAIGTLYTGLWPHTNSDVWKEVPNPELTQDDELGNADSKRKQIGGDHYAKHTIQPWDIIREYKLDFFEGSCISYILRRKNNRLEDLRKAAHYLEECIKNEQKRIDNV